MTTEKKRMGVASLTLVWVGALMLTLLAFYGLDHFIMSLQGLPLNMDLSPAQ